MSKTLRSRKPKANKVTAIVKRASGVATADTGFDEVLALIDAARVQTMAAVNTALIDLYWTIGKYISGKIALEQWGKGTMQDATVFNFFDDFVYTSPVGSFKPNAWGLYDMDGNVRQWCADWGADYNGDATDPAGAGNGKARVLRGGAWDLSPRFCRSANRVWYEPESRNGGFGFRVCLPLDSE